MATITSTIRLVDRMTPTLTRISRAIDNVNRQSGNLGRSMERANTAMLSNTRGLSGMQSAANGVLSAFRRILVTLGVIKAINSFGETADSMMNATARIDNINDGLNTTAGYLDQIYEAAQRSRGNFTQMASSVGKLGMLAGDAFGGSVSEMIQFNELMNKLFVISGSSAAEASNAMYQLTQAMAAGKLQGDEMRSIMENAPLLARKIADELGVTTAEVKELGSEGKITADVIKKALFDAADEIEEKFENMPKTIGQTWTEICNYCVNSFRPVIERVQQFINSPVFQNIKNKVFGIIDSISNAIIVLIETLETPRVQNAINDITNAFSLLWTTAQSIGQKLADLAVWVADNWAWISAIIYGVITLIALYNVTMTVMWIAQGISAWIAALIAGQAWAWVILIIVALVAVIYLGVYAWNEMAGTSVSALGVILGTVAFVIACVWDLLVFIWDGLGTVWAAIVAIGKILWQVLTDCLQFLISVLIDYVTFWMNVYSAAVALFVGIGKRAMDTFWWLLDVLKVWGGNMLTGMSQLVDNLGAYWEMFKAMVCVQFWSVVDGAVNAFNDLIQGSYDTCVKMLTPFADFADGVKKLFNKIKSWWNQLAEKLSTGFTVPQDLINAASLIGISLPSNIGISVPTFDIDESPITAEGWIGKVEGLTEYTGAKLAEAQAALAATKGSTSPVNWSTNEIPKYEVEWDGLFDEVKEAFNRFEYENPLDAFEWDSYVDIWDEFAETWDRTWNPEDYLNPFEMFQDWYNIGKGTEDTIAGLVDMVGGMLDAFEGKNKEQELINMQNQHVPTMEELLVDGGMPKDNAGLEGSGKSPFESAYNDPISDLIGSIADNTGSTAGGVSNIEDTLDLAEEELELLRKIAEQEVINRFTTAEIKVDMTNNNNISSKMDLDGIVTHLSNKLYEELGVVASGVHY